MFHRGANEPGLVVFELASFVAQLVYYSSQACTNKTSFRVLNSASLKLEIELELSPVHVYVYIQLKMFEAVQVVGTQLIFLFLFWLCRRDH